LTDQKNPTYRPFFVAMFPETTNFLGPITHIH